MNVAAVPLIIEVAIVILLLLPLLLLLLAVIWIGLRQFFRVSILRFIVWFAAIGWARVRAYERNEVQFRLCFGLLLFICAHIWSWCGGRSAATVDFFRIYSIVCWISFRWFLFFNFLLLLVSLFLRWLLRGLLFSILMLFFCIWLFVIFQ